MAVRVLVVDDSKFFRDRVSEILNEDKRLEVVGVAENGQQAIEMVAQHRPDVITMDIEMPVMDGITAVKKIMAKQPTPVLIFSSYTTQGAKVTLDALDAGAVDFLPKRIDELARTQEDAHRHLCSRVWQVGVKGKHLAVNTHALPVKTPLVEKRAPIADKKETMQAGDLAHYSVLAIGSSTGGPIALQEILSKLPASFPLPITITQHMPGTFTNAFASRLNQLCGIQVKEAEDGDVLMPGVAYLAPGGKQMLVVSQRDNLTLKIEEAQAGQTYKPSVDLTYTSLAKLLPGKVLAVILTGMGADGREGGKLLKQGRSTVWAQNEETCVVFGMPGAVVEAGLADQILPLNEIGPQLVAGM